MRMDLGKSGVRVMGTWSSSTAYEKNDIVTDGGDGYISITDVPVGTALSNTAYWLKIVNGFSADEVTEAVNAWLVAHPEATTTIQDGAVTTAKIADGAVTDAKLAQTGGVLSKADYAKDHVSIYNGSYFEGSTEPLTSGSLSWVATSGTWKSASYLTLEVSAEVGDVLTFCSEYMDCFSEQGMYIKELDVDDTQLKQAIVSQLDLLNEHKNADYTYAVTESGTKKVQFIPGIKRNANINGMPDHVVGQTYYIKNACVYKGSLASSNKLNLRWDKVQNIQTAQLSNFTLAIQTDTHYKINGSEADKLAGNTLNALSHYVGFDFIANLGDVISGYTADTNTDMREAMTQIINRYVKGISCPFMVAMGNHDTNAMWAEANDVDPFSHAEVWGREFKPAFNTNPKAVTQTGIMYYYTDFNDVRVIVLNTQDGINGGFGIGSTQLAWFTNIALNTDKWVLVMSHVPLVNGWSVNSNYVSSYADIVSALQAFKANNGKVIGCFSGHTHTKETKTVDNILYVTFADGAEVAEVVMIDLTNKNISTIGLGRLNTANRSFTFS